MRVARKFRFEFVLLLLLGLLIYGCAVAPQEKINFANYVNNSWEKAKALFIQPSDLPSLVKNSYVLLYQNLAYIERYKNKYPELTENLQKVNSYIIKRKTRIIVEKFLETRGNAIIEKYRTLNLKLVDEFEKGLEEYLKKVKETNGEIFVGELFGLVGMVKSVKNSEKYVERVFEERFLSKEMLADAISKYLEQLDARLEENMNRFLVDMEAEFLAYLKEIGETEFLFEPDEIYKPVEKTRILKIYNETFPKLSEELCPKEIRKEISSKLRKNLAGQVGSTILGFVPRVKFLLGFAADAAAMFYEHKLKGEVERALDQIVIEIKAYVMEPDGLDLRYKITAFIENYEKKKQALLKKVLIEQYEALQEDIFIRGAA